MKRVFDLASEAENIGIYAADIKNITALLLDELDNPEYKQEEHSPFARQLSTYQTLLRSVLLFLIPDIINQANEISSCLYQMAWEEKEESAI